METSDDGTSNASQVDPPNEATSKVSSVISGQGIPITVVVATLLLASGINPVTTK